jgi:hypothetical protein
MAKDPEVHVYPVPDGTNTLPEKEEVNRTTSPGLGTEVSASPAPPESTQ